MSTAAFPYDLFLSHSAKDKAVVPTPSLSAANGERARVRCRSFRLDERLRQDGLKVWFDDWVLKPSVPLAHRMGEGAGERAANAGASDGAQWETGTCGRRKSPLRAPLNQKRRFNPQRLDDAPIKGSLAHFLLFQEQRPVLLSRPWN